MILQVSRTKEKPCVLRTMFCKLDVRRKSIVTLALSYTVYSIVDEVVGTDLQNILRVPRADC